MGRGLDPVRRLLDARARHRLRRAVARTLLAALLLETTPALAESISIRSTPRGWEPAAAVARELGRTAEQAAARGLGAAGAVAMRTWERLEASSEAGVDVVGRRVRPLFEAGATRVRSLLAFSSSRLAAAVASRAAASGGGESLPPSPPGFTATGELSSLTLATSSSGDLPLAAGWNLVSLPSRPADAASAAVFASLGSALVRVWAYDRCDAADPWKVYDPASPATSDLLAVSETMGLWIETSAPVVLATTGEPPLTSTIPLCPGWNHVGFPASVPRTVASALAPIAGKYARVFGYDAEAGRADRAWKVADPVSPDWADSLLTMSPGKGFWILATEATDWTVSNVGTELVASFSAPAELAEVVGPVAIAGTASGASLASWELTARALEGGEAWTLASGTAPAAGTLAELDPTLLLNGLYELELAAYDTEGSGIAVERSILVAGQRKIGVFNVAFLDLEVPIAGLPLQVVRTYDTRRKAQRGDFGHGWTLEVGAGSYRTNGPAGTGWQIAPGGGPFGLPCTAGVESRGHRATIRLSDAEIYIFRPRLTELAPTLGGCFATFGWEYVDGPLPGASLEVIGRTSIFWSNGDSDLVDAEDLELFDPRQARLRTRDGRLFEIDRASGVTKLGDANGNTVEIEDNSLIHSTGATVAFERDELGRIERLVDAEGQATTFEYDAAGDLVATTNPEGERTTFGYEDHALVEAEDPRGEIVLRNVYEAGGRLGESVDAFGRPIRFEHRLAENLEIVTNRLGKERLYEYDARGNVIREVDELGRTTTRTFFADGLPLSETNPLGETTRFAYDGQKNLTSTTDPLGHVTRFTYNGRGDVLAVTDPLGRVTTNVYDSRGNLTRTTGPSGEVTAYAYDATGRILEELDPLGGRTTFAYDHPYAWLGPSRETDALGHSTRFAYNQLGAVASECRDWTNAAGETETLETGYRYDGAKRLIRTLAPDGTETATEYSRNGQVTAAIDAIGRRTELTYDAAGRPLRTTYPDGTYEESGYDAEGRRTSARDRGGRTSSYEYDDAGRLTKAIAPDGATTEQVYDETGRLVETIDARGKSTYFVYDAAGRRTRVRDHLGHETSFDYDAAGNQVAITDAKGATTRFEYDDSGRLVRTVFPDDTFATTVYDALGRRTGETDQAGRTTELGYDALGRLVSVTDALGQVTRYGYDELGNRISQLDANGHETRFGYDRLGRQTHRTLPVVAGVAATERFEYDAVGNRSKRWDFLGRLTSYTYDPQSSRLLRRDYPDGSFHAFTYTPTGRRETAVDARGTTVYGYDGRDRLASLTYPDGRRLEYAHDEVGNRTSLAAVIGEQTLTTSYTYDDLNRLDTVTDPLGQVYPHAYDDNGNRQSLDFPNGVHTTYQYDASNRLKDLATINSAGETIVSFAYTLGPAGNRTRIVEHDGTTRDYQYDALYRLTDEYVTLAGATRWRNGFVYDPVGNRLRQDRIETSGSQRVVTYAYDERDRLLSEASGDSTLYGWDENGNQISKSGPLGASYEWDFENRLVRVTLADGTVVEHDYDADGTRLRTTTTTSGSSPEVVDYLVDTTGISQVVAESNNAGAVMALHVRGDDLLATLRPNGAGWTERYFHAEGIGSIRALTDALGAVADRYGFEAFGTFLDHDGEDENSHLFAGEPFDPTIGFYYLRARWLDGRTHSFVSLDPALQFAGHRDGVLPYVFASSDPANRTDPTGLSPTLRGPAPWAAARVGTYVHHQIGIDFRSKGANRFANYTQIWKVLGFAGPGGCRTSALFCRLKPDLVDGRSGAVYEIKPFGFVSPSIGYFELALYLATLEANDLQARMWHPGTTYQPPRYMFVPILGGWDVVILPPINGVIAYRAISRIVTAATISGLVTLAINAVIGQAQAITAQATLTTATSRGYF